MVGVGVVDQLSFIAIQTRYLQSRFVSYAGPVCQPQCQAPGFCDRDTGKCFCGDLKLVTEWCTNGKTAF